jgi:ubiquinone/menaquinone biosynthesis C-methylase UbiE
VSGHVCPWWLGPVLASPVRRLVHDPAKILGPHVRPGMTVLEVGPGMGFFTLELARLVGPDGRVVAVDVQEKMLAGLRRRAERAGIAGLVELRRAAPERLGVDDLAGKVDLVIAFAVVHEMPDAGRFFEEVRPLLAPGGKVLLAEPSGHVSAGAFAETLGTAEAAGLWAAPAPKAWRSRTAVLSPIRS